VNPATDARSGETLNGAYELHERIEGDGLSESYHARALRGGHDVTVRILRPEHALRPDSAGRFLAVPKALRELAHPAIAAVLAIETDDTGIPYVVEQYPDGQRLSECVLALGPEAIARTAVEVLLPICDALAAAHGQKLVHGRLDREHVLVAREDGRLVPRIVGFVGSSASSRVQARVTPPERRGHGRPPDPRGDLWCLGLLALEILTGRRQAGTSNAELKAAMEPLFTKLPAELCQALVECLASNPARRPSSPAPLQTALVAMQRRLEGEGSAISATSRRQTGRVSDDELALQETMTGLPAQQPSEPGGDASGDAFAQTLASEAGGAALAETLASDAGDALADTMAASVGDDGALAETLASDAEAPGPADGDESVSEVRPRSKPRGQIRTAELAAAFLPLEGLDSVGQKGADDDATRPEPPTGDADSSPRKRRSSLGGFFARSAQLASADDATGRGDQDEDEEDEDESTKVGAVLKARGPAAKPKPVPIVIIQPRRSRFRALVNTVLMLLFALLLLLAIPILMRRPPSPEQLAEDSRTTFSVAGIAILSLIAMVKVWAVQIQLKPTMWRPVNISLQLTAICVCVLAVGYVVPGAGLGPLESLARRVLPWVGAGFFFALSIFGMLRGLRDMGGNALLSLVMMLLSLAGLYGPYRTVRLAIDPERDADAQKIELRDADGNPVIIDESDKLDLEKARQALTTRDEERPQQELMQRTEMGGGEDDMKAIEEMRKSRRQTHSNMDEFKQQMQNVAR